MVHTGIPSSGLCSGGASAPLFSPTRRMHAESGSSLLSFSRNLQTFQPSNFQTILRSIPFRITSFAGPHPLTLIESHLYEKQGRGWGLRHLAPTRAQGTCATRSNTRNLNLFIHLLNDPLDTPGVGGSPLSFARLRGFCVSALSFSAPQFSLLLDTGGPQ
jgi:hypothetical protein